MWVQTEISVKLLATAESSMLMLEIYINILQKPYFGKNVLENY